MLDGSAGGRVAAQTTPDPRPSNTGVTPSPPPLPHHLGSGLRSRFDWYEWTADGLDDGRVPAGLALALGGALRPGKGRNGYGRSEVIERDGVALATVFGGSAREGEVHVVITGEACDLAVPVTRRLWPQHRVSRADSALDFVADFDELDAQLVEFANARGLKHELIVNSEGGATRYVGGRTSEVRLRLYKKTEQWRSLHPERAEEIADGIVRTELQVRPGKRAIKDRAATLDADDFWGFGQWAQDFARSVLQLDPVRSPTVFRRPSDWTRAVYFLGLQYGPMVRERADLDGIELVAAEIFAALGLAGRDGVIPEAKS